MCLIMFSLPLYLLWFFSSVPKAQGALQTTWSQAGSAPFSFYYENNVELLCFFFLAPLLLELEAVCVSIALLLCPGVRWFGECFLLLPMEVLEAVLSTWLSVRSSCKCGKLMQNQQHAELVSMSRGSQLWLGAINRAHECMHWLVLLDYGWPLSVTVNFLLFLTSPFCFWQHSFLHGDVVWVWPVSSPFKKHQVTGCLSGKNRRKGEGAG